MSLKQKKYFDTKNIYKIFENNANNIFLFAHVNNLSTMEVNRIKSYCVENNIINNYIKLNLLKKLTKNLLFINLMAGPSKIFFFSNFNLLFEFINTSYIKKKIIPLTIYWNNNFYKYNFIENYFNKSNKISQLSLKENQSKLLLSLKNPNINFINLFNNNINQLIYILTYINKKKQ